MLHKIDRRLGLAILVVLVGGMGIEASLLVKAKANIPLPAQNQYPLHLAISTNTPNITTSATRLTFNDVQGGAASAAKTLTFSNTGNANLTISNLAISGTNANQFQITNKPTLPVTLKAGSSTKVSIAFNPTTIGPKGGSLQIKSNDPDTSVATVNLRGLGTKGLGGGNEPSLQWILDTCQIPIKVGDPDPTNNSLPTTKPLGDEVALPQFEKAGAGAVKVEVIAVFGPQSSSGIVTRFGYYSSGNASSKHQLFTVPNASYQSLKPSVSGSTSFDPGTSNFSFYSIWPFFNNRNVYGEDHLNTFTGAIPHHVRVYPLKNANGTVASNAYVVATEEHISGFDYQDIVVVVRNVKPATTAILESMR